MKFVAKGFEHALFFGGDGKDYTPGLIYADMSARLLASKKVRVLSVTVEIEDEDGVQLLMTCPAEGAGEGMWMKFAVPLKPE
jgi:hypothetical protein